jgi:hypothetical protein
MAVVRFFRKRPVKRMREVPGGIRLIFFSPTAGEPGEQLTVSQADWELHGDKRFMPDEQANAEALRKLAAKAAR